MTYSTRSGSLECLTEPRLPAGGKGALRFAYRPAGALAPGTKLWFIYDIRQDAGPPQSENPEAPNHVAVTSAQGTAVVCRGYGARTLDLYPVLPEFLHVCEIDLPGGLPAGDELTVHLGSEKGPWTFSRHPIDPFRFWLVEGKTPDRTFEPTGYKTYRTFDPPLDLNAPLVASVAFAGSYAPFAPENTRKTPGILWGEIHGMVFNQRPLDDYYNYAIDVAKFDFAAPMLFSYNVCVGDIWDRVKDAAERFTRPGEFVGIAGIEFGTPPDGSHRNAHFFDHRGVPPIFFEERPPALDPRLHRRFHPDTLFCRDLDHFYETIATYNGTVTAHFHTLRYGREILAEFWQKQKGSAAEEERNFGYLNDGMRLGIVCGSDTHDSMPGNPHPEPGCPQPAGFMAVLSHELTPGAIYRAILDRRVYGTTGARIALHLDVSGSPMGSVLPLSAPREFRLRVEGSAPLSKIDLIRNGSLIDSVEPSGDSWEGALRDGSTDAYWYLVRVAQKDGHRAWSSPVWFE